MAGTFALDLARLCKKADVDVQTVIRKLAFTAFSKVVLKTPVDKGRARANWSVRVAQPNTNSSTLETDKSGAATVQKIQDAVTLWGCEGSIFLTSNLAYVPPLEYGHSKQAPNGMVRVTVEEMQNWVNGVRVK